MTNNNQKSEEIAASSKDEIITNSSKRIALFPGTFDPFTIGHESLVRRGLSIMHKIIISIGVNE